MSYKLPKKIKNLWIEALRSNKYKQGKYYLKNTDQEEDRYCCIGVLCDILFKNNLIDIDENLFHKPYPSKKIYEFLKIEDVEEITKFQEKFSQMNDYGNRTFEEISNYISEIY